MDFKYLGVNVLEQLDSSINYNNYLKKRLKSNLKDKSNVLDFGTGLGTMSSMLKEENIEAKCVEIDRDLKTRLESLGFTVKADIGEYTDGSFSFIYSLNVLEHIEDDFKTLRDMYTKLKPSGVLYLYVPAFNVLYSSFDKKVGHYRRYSKGNLRDLLIKSGFEIKKSEYVDSLGFFAALAYKLLGNKSGDLDSSKVRFYDKFIFPISKKLDFFFSGFLGKNLEFVAVKK